jgi:hypothetical protein
MRHEGGCHCGALRLRLDTERPLAPRACRCGFCRRHNVRMVSDPNGAAELMLGAEAQTYRFGTSATDFLICRRCGVYVGAVAELDGRIFATLNLNAFDDPRRDLAAMPVSYDGETPEARAVRRRAKWTPAQLLRA